VQQGEFLETIAREKHARDVFHLNVYHIAPFKRYCSTLDLGPLSYCCKIIIDYEDLLATRFTDAVNPENEYSEFEKEYGESMQFLSKSIASIPNVRNVEIVHALQYAELGMYDEGQKWPVILSTNEISDPSNQFVPWMIFCNRVYSSLPRFPQSGFSSSIECDRERRPIETHLVVKPLDVLDSAETIRSSKVRVWNAIVGMEHEFRKKDGDKYFEYIHHDKYFKLRRESKILVPSSKGYGFYDVEREDHSGEKAFYLS
jgi:hypothetical protein